MKEKTLTRKLAMIGSHKTTLVLLGAYAILLGTATLVEKCHGTSTVHNNYYHLTVGVLWILLIVNWLVQTLQKRKHFKQRCGIFLLHTSFLFFIGGTIISHYTSIEGTIHVREGEQTNEAITEKNEKISLPFQIYLNDFQLSRHPESNTPHSYKSIVTIYEKNTFAKMEIYMNKVISIQKYRLFQTAYDEDEAGTILTVSYNPAGIPFTYAGYTFLFFGIIVLLFQKESRLRLLTGCRHFQHKKKKNIRLAGDRDNNKLQPSISTPLKKVSLLAFLILASQAFHAQNEYVNTFIGTQGMGHTFPGACVPFGFVQLSPDTDTLAHNINGVYNKDVYAYCAGYQYDDSTIVGFSHTHFNGTGHSDLGDILIMPSTGKLQLSPGRSSNPAEGYRSGFSHQTEKARPGYYEVVLEDHRIKAQLTATCHTGIHKYTYLNKDKDGRFILDLNHGIYNYDGKTLWASIRVENDTLITGYRITNGWARTNHIYFAISLSKPIKKYGYADKAPAAYNGFWRRFNVRENFPEMAGRKIVAYFEFDTSTDNELEIKVALSGVSTAGALRNLHQETGGKDFDAIAQEAENKWKQELGNIKVEGSDDQKSMFYTSYYHTMINPSVYTDTDGKYRGIDHNVHQASDFTNYSIFSLWDTYRAEHPLLALMKPQNNEDMVQSMLKHQQQSVHGMLPVWSHMANENWCMSGYHAVSVLLDAIAKGADINPKEALKAMVETSKVPYYEGMKPYLWFGYVPLDVSQTAASTTLEYAYDDWCIYKLAQMLGEDEIMEEYRQRALNYRKLFDRSTGFACPRYSNGAFKTNFDPLQTHGEGFIEGNSWNFSFHAPHDVNGLISLMGGDHAFIKRLDQLFTMELPSKYYEKNEDITQDCLLGGYVHGNEPSHHIPYLYAWTSQPWKTQYWVREIMNRMYRNRLDGLSGNDDCGQMSAWYLFTSLGFYPVCPGSNQYILGAPYLPYQELQLPNGKTFKIKAPEVSDKKRYVRSVLLNGKPYSKTYITHEDIMAGGEITFIMSGVPNKKRGIQAKDKPYSLTDGQLTNIEAKWAKHQPEKLYFKDEATLSNGSHLYHSLIKDPETFIKKHLAHVLNTLYFAPTDSIPPIHQLEYVLKDENGVSAKEGSNGEIKIWYSTRHIEQALATRDTAHVLYETEGVLLHELTHAVQLEPQGIGNYGNSKLFRALIEGVADAVRVINGHFTVADRIQGGSYMDGYRTTGFFFAWIQRTKDPNFLKKINQSTLKVVPWSFNEAIKYCLGNEYDIDLLWQEYLEDTKGQ